MICVFSRIQHRKQKRKSRRTASIDGGNLLAKTGLVLEGGAIFEGQQNAKQNWHLAFLGPSKTRITTDSLRYDAGHGRDLWRPSVLHGCALKRGNVALFLHVISEAQLGEGIREREFSSDDY